MTRSGTSAALLSALILGQHASVARAEPARSPEARKSLPADVLSYLDRRKGCAHWSGEEPYDAARGLQIAAAVKTLRCDDVEADETRLRKRYGSDPSVRKALDAAESTDG